MSGKRIKRTAGGSWMADSLFGGAIGLAAALAAALLLSALAMKSENAMSLSVPIAALCLFIGGAVGGYIGAHRGQDIRTGLAAGGVMLLPVILISLFVSGSGGAFGILAPLCGLVLGSAAGGFAAHRRAASGRHSLKKAMKRR